MMIGNLSGCSDAVQSNAYREMFSARKAVFVDLLKWNVPVLEDKYELDQFDNEHADYLIVAEADGTHLGSCRLLPTARPHILDSFYPELCEDGAPIGPHIFEVTRFCLDRRLTARERRAVRDTLVTMLAEHALARGIETYTAIAELGWSHQILTFGWRCAALGLPRMIDGKLLAALRIDIDQQTPSRLQACGIKAATSVGPVIAVAA